MRPGGSMMEFLTGKHDGPFVDLTFRSQAEMHHVLFMLSWDWQLPTEQELGIDEFEIYDGDMKVVVRSVISFEERLGQVEFEEATGKLNFDLRKRGWAA